MAEAGRPKKGENNVDCRNNILLAAVEIIKKEGANNISVRYVCDTAGVSIGTFYHYFSSINDLMMTFIKDESFDMTDCTLAEDDIVGRITELYMILIRRYQSFGVDFMKSFYTADNLALSAYMGQKEGRFAEKTVMWHCEKLISDAISKQYLSNRCSPHRASEDICIIAKGCIFEWCLCDADMEIEETLRHILSSYLSDYRRGL